MEKLILEMATIILGTIRKRFAEYEEECAEYAKQGYRPHYCIHGTNQWTDYDNICGACEDGEGYWHYDTMGRIALDQAKSAYKEFNERLDMVLALSRKRAPFDMAKMGDWVNEPLEATGYVPKHKRPAAPRTNHLV